jgi:hypothetical protein
MNGDEWNPKHFDEDGNEYELTETGARRPPMTTSKKDPSGWGDDKAIIIRVLDLNETQILPGYTSEETLPDDVEL